MKYDNTNVQCPYCEGWFREDFSDETNYDTECPHCGKEVEIEVEFDPIYYASKIEYVECPICKKQHRDDVDTIPRPKSLDNMPKNEYKKVCYSCWHKEIWKDYQ